MSFHKYQSKLKIRKLTALKFDSNYSLFFLQTDAKYNATLFFIASDVLMCQ